MVISEVTINKEVKYKMHQKQINLINSVGLKPICCVFFKPHFAVSHSFQLAQTLHEFPHSL